MLSPRATTYVPPLLTPQLHWGAAASANTAQDPPECGRVAYFSLILLVSIYLFGVSFWLLLQFLFLVNYLIIIYSYSKHSLYFFQLNWETFFGHTISVMNLGFTDSKGLMMTISSRIPWLQVDLLYFCEVNICIQLPEVSLFQNAGSNPLNFSR